MARILASDGMEKSAVDKLTSLGHEVVMQFYEPDDLAQQVKNFDVLVVRSATKVRAPVIDAAAETGKLKLILRGGVGVDNIDVAYAQSKGIKVNNTPMASSAAVAELVIGHMFCLARFIHIANVTMRDGKWNKKDYEGIELAGKTLGLMGIGRIGRNVADRAACIGMKVIYTEHPSFVPNDDVYKRVTADELIAQADFISLHMPKLNNPVLTAHEFEKMKDGVYIINAARGGLVVEDDLIAALDSGKVAGAALDVFTEEPTKNEKLYTHPKVSVTPHIGASTAEAQSRIGEEIVSQILDMFK